MTTIYTTGNGEHHQTLVSLEEMRLFSHKLLDNQRQLRNWLFAHYCDYRYCSSIERTPPIAPLEFFSHRNDFCKIEARLVDGTNLYITVSFFDLWSREGYDEDMNIVSCGFFVDTGSENVQFIRKQIVSTWELIMWHEWRYGNWTRIFHAPDVRAR